MAALRPLENRHVAITGLRGGVGALLAKQVLLLGAAKVILHHPGSDKETVTEETVEACGGVLRERDLGDELPAALGRRLRQVAERRRIEVLGPDAPVEGNDSFAAADVVFCCDGAGPLSVVAGLGEAARRRPRGRQTFILAQARGLVGTVFVDSGDPTVAQTLYQSLRPTQNKNEIPRRSTDSDVERRRQEVLHAEFLRSHPETRPLLPPKKTTKTSTGDEAGILRSAEKEEEEDDDDEDEDEEEEEEEEEEDMDGVDDGAPGGAAAAVARRRRGRRLGMDGTAAGRAHSVAPHAYCIHST